MCLLPGDESATELETRPAAFVQGSEALQTAPEDQVPAAVVPVVERLLQVGDILISKPKSGFNADQHMM